MNDEFLLLSFSPEYQDPEREAMRRDGRVRSDAAGSNQRRDRAAARACPRSWRRVAPTRSAPRQFAHPHGEDGSGAWGGGMNR